jgi:hypothetical protein
MGPRFKWGSNVVVVVDGRGRRRQGSCGAKILGFLILMAEASGYGFW